MIRIPSKPVVKTLLRACYLVLWPVLLAMTLSACQHSPEPGQQAAPLPVKVPDPDVDISAFELPQQLDDLRLIGDAQREHGSGRLFLYQSGRPGDEARVILYPMAGGWDTLPPDTVVAGQYGLVRERILSRLSRQGYGTIEGSGEGLYQSEALAYPIAELLLQSKTRASKPAHIVLLGVAPPVFVRVERMVSVEQAPVAAPRTRHWLEQVIQALVDNSQASSKGRLANDSNVDAMTDAATCSADCP